MEEGRKKPGATQVLVILASLVVLVAALKAISSILLPVLVALFLAVLSLPPVAWLQRRRVPDWLAVLLVFFVVIIILSLISAVVGNSVQSFIKNIPTYQALLTEKLHHLLSHFGDLGSVNVDKFFHENVEVGQLMSIAGLVVGALGGMLSNTVFVLLTLVFIMGEAAGFPQKLKTVMGGADADISNFGIILGAMNQYLKIKALVSLVTGVLAGLLAYFVGVDFPFLWGLLAFFLNFIPTLGSIIAGVPPVILALVQFGWHRALIMMAGYVAINMVMGNLVEPKVMGRSLGLSALVVFLSMVFWGWVWGPVGMILSVPLTMMLKIMMEHSENMRWLAVLAGAKKDTPQPE